MLQNNFPASLPNINGITQNVQNSSVVNQRNLNTSAVMNATNTASPGFPTIVKSFWRDENSEPINFNDLATSPHTTKVLSSTIRESSEETKNKICQRFSEDKMKINLAIF